MADSIFQPMRFTIDLDSALVTQTGCGRLIYGDRLANVIEVKVQRGGKAIDLTGMTATGAFYRPVDGAEVPLPGAISANMVSVQLIDECYETEGHYEAEVKLSQGEVMRTILSIVGYVHRAGSGTVVNVTGVVPSIPELLAQISAMKTAAERANTAAARAEALAIDASGYALNAKQLNGKDAAYYIGARNLLDNSNFEIAQAGYNAAHGNEFYLCDRWITSVQSGTKLNNGVLFANNGGIVYQRVSGVAGKTVTFAIKTNGTGEQHMSVYTADLGNMIQQIWGYKNSDGIVCGTATIPSDIDVAAFILYPENGSIIEWVVLYEGEYTAETLPPYMPKGYVAELMECQRYFLTCGSVPFFRYAGGAGTEYFAGGMRFPVPMRIVPSVVAYSDVTNVGFVTPSTITYDNLSITAFGYDSASPIPQGTRAYMEFVASADL